MYKNMEDEIKLYYGGIAKKVSESAETTCGCKSSCCEDKVKETILYSKEFIDGIPQEAINASLGCANPLVLANLKLGESVLDLGSGGGIDVLISAKYVGESGKVYGLDMTDEMLALANQNKNRSGANNVEFIKGYIEDIPLQDETVDVVTSNCVINLCENKEDALGEAYRVLKEGGRLAIADIVQMKTVPEEIRQNIQMWVGCISGALTVEEYERILKKVGFHRVEITPVNIYTKDIMKQFAESKKLENVYAQIDEELLDGAFAGAHVKAYK